MQAVYTERRFGHNLKNARKKKGMSQTELALKMGLAHRNSLTDLENGKHSPTLHTMQRIATALGISLLELLYPEMTQRDQRYSMLKTHGIAKVVGQIKGYTAHMLRTEYPWEYVDAGLAPADW